MNELLKDLKNRLSNKIGDEVENTSVSVRRNNLIASTFDDMLEIVSTVDLEAFMNENDPQIEEFVFGDTSPLFNAIQATTRMSETAKTQLISLLEDGVGGRPTERKPPPPQ